MSDTPSVLIVTDVYPPGCGGSGWSTDALVRTLADRGHRVEVVELDAARDGVSRRRYDGVDVETLGLRRARANPVRRLGAREYSFAAVRGHVARRLGEDPGIAVVHAQHLHSGPGALDAARAAGRAAVLNLRDHWPVCLHGVSWWGGRDCAGCTRANLVGCMGYHWGMPAPVAALWIPWARRRLAARARDVHLAHRLVAPSESLRGRLEARIGPLPVEVIPNIVDPERSRRLADAADREHDALVSGPYLLAAGKLNEGKGFDALIEWLGRCEHRLPLVLAGTGPLRRRLEARARDLDLELRSIDWLDAPELLRLMRGAAAVALPSRIEEALARTLLEAMSVGTPVVSWPVASSRELIDTGETGWVVSGVDELDAALAALADPSRRRRMGEAALARVAELFAPRAVYPRVASVYGAALAAAGR